jgi:DNA-binding NarL/FixJ family response regulator
MAVWLSFLTVYDGSRLDMNSPEGWIASQKGRWPPRRAQRRAAALLGMTEARKRILCIDDDRSVTEMIAEDLAERGFEVTVCHDGLQGLVAILKTMPDLVLCDVNMPFMSGFEILERLNTLAPRLGRIPFVFLTALADRDSELRGRRLGADDYVTKPIDFDILGMIINARLAGVARNDIWPRRVTLNDREIEVLTWVARGKTSTEVSELLGLAKRTVDFHLDNARVKLSAATRTEAAIKAAIGKLIDP